MKSAVTWTPGRPHFCAAAPASRPSTSASSTRVLREVRKERADFIPATLAAAAPRASGHQPSSSVTLGLVPRAYGGCKLKGASFSYLRLQHPAPSQEERWALGTSPRVTVLDRHALLRRARVGRVQRQARRLAGLHHPQPAVHGL